MGRPARNHGGTGGHGCPPLPGERPNINCHVLSDKTLLTMVQDTKKRPRGTPKIEILKDFPKDGIKANRKLDSFSFVEPKQSEMQSEPVASLEETGTMRGVQSQMNKIQQRVSPLDKRKSPTTVQAKKQPSNCKEMAQVAIRKPADISTCDVRQMPKKNKISLVQLPVSAAEKPVPLVKHSTVPASSGQVPIPSIKQPHHTIEVQGASKQLSHHPVEMLSPPVPRSCIQNAQHEQTHSPTKDDSSNSLGKVKGLIF